MRKKARKGREGDGGHRTEAGGGMKNVPKHFWVEGGHMLVGRVGSLDTEAVKRAGGGVGREVEGGRGPEGRMSRSRGCRTHGGMTS